MACLLAKRVVPYTVSTVTSNQCRSAVVLNCGRWSSTGAGNYGGVGVGGMNKNELVRAREMRRAAVNQQHEGNGRGDSFLTFFLLLRRYCLRCNECVGHIRCLTPLL